MDSSKIRCEFCDVLIEKASKYHHDKSNKHQLNHQKYKNLKLTKEINRLKSCIQDMENEKKNHSSETEIKKLNERIEELKQELLKKDKKIEDLNHKFFGKNRKIEDVELEIANLKNKLRKKDRQILKILELETD